MKSLYHAKLNPTLSPENKEQLIEVLAKHHSIFSLRRDYRIARNVGGVKLWRISKILQNFGE